MVRSNGRVLLQDARNSDPTPESMTYYRTIRKMWLKSRMSATNFGDDDAELITAMFSFLYASVMDWMDTG